MEINSYCDFTHDKHLYLHKFGSTSKEVTILHHHTSTVAHNVDLLGVLSFYPVY